MCESFLVSFGLLKETDTVKSTLYRENIQSYVYLSLVYEILSTECAGIIVAIVANISPLV